MYPNRTIPTQVALAPEALSSGVCAETGGAGGAGSTTVLLRLKHALTAQQIDEDAAEMIPGEFTHPRLAGVSLVIKHVVEPSGSWRVSLSLSSYSYLRHPDGAVSKFWTVDTALVLKPSASGALLVQRRDDSEFSTMFCDSRDVKSFTRTTADRMIRRAIIKALELDRSRGCMELGGTLGDLLGPVKHADEQSVWHQSNTASEDAAEAVTEIITQITDRCPRLADLMPPELADKAAQSLPRPMDRVVPITVMPYLLGASDMREVTGRLFGKRRVNKPLIRICTQLLVKRPWYDSALIWARLFRGLVPVEDITAWLEQVAQHKDLELPGLSKRHQDRLRAVLRNLSQPVLRRLLARPVLETTVGLMDIVYRRHHIDPVLLGEVVQLRGHRNIRGVNDLEQLARTLPEKKDISGMRSRIAAQRRESVRKWIQVCDLLRDGGEHTAPTWDQWQDPDIREQLMDHIEQAQQAQREEQERIRAEQAELRRQERIAQEAEKVARTAQLRGPMNKIRIGRGKDQLKVVVAKNAETLARWGNQMGHCIADYDIRIDLDTMFAVVDAQGTVLVNGHIGNDHLIQLYAKRNKPARKALSQEHLDQLLSELEKLGVGTAHAAGVQ